MRTGQISSPLLAVVALWVVAVWPTKAEDGDAKSTAVTPGNAETEMVTALEEMVGIRERQLASLKLLAGTGRVEAAAVDDATVELWRAKNRLAEARRQPDVVIEGLREILAIREEAWRRIQPVFQAGRVGGPAMEAARLQVLEARIDLCRATVQRPRNP
jgi:hypothetical protein